MGRSITQDLTGDRFTFCKLALYLIMWYDENNNSEKAGTNVGNKRITMQDVADACGLSRNTVSKAFNGRGAVPPSTRAFIIQKAAELGYGLPAREKPAVPSAANSIALLTSNMPMDYHFGTFFMTTFTDQICRAGYTLKMFEVSSEELRQKQLPPPFVTDQVAGIVAIELFDQPYLDMICGLGLPTIVIDSPSRAIDSLMSCDFVSMENAASVISVTKRLAALGARRIGFVGDKEHCGSFFERWVGFQIGLRNVGINYDEQACILASDSSPYNNTDWLIAQLEQMRQIPDAFVCANDYLAIHLMNALKKKGLAIPGDVMVTGFDGTSQSALVEPQLTTVQIPSIELGRMAADILLNRIHNPDLPYNWTRVRTTPVWRDSTR